MITPQEAAKLVDWPNPSRRNEIHQFLFKARARDVQLFIHNIQTDTIDANTWRERAEMALAIRISEDAAEAANKLATETNKLVGQVVELVSIAAEQKRLAAKLDGMTEELIRLTVRLNWLTAGLIFLTLVLCLLEFGLRESSLL